MPDMELATTNDRIALTTYVVSAYVSNNSIPVAELSSLIAAVHSALHGLGEVPALAEGPSFEKPTAARIRKSVSPDGIVSFIDGKTYKSMKRHLTGNGLDPDTYRERYGLPADYPMVSANYSAARSALAKTLGLGQQRRKAAAPEPVAEAAPAKPRGRGRPRTAAPMAAE